MKRYLRPFLLAFIAFSVITLVTLFSLHYKRNGATGLAVSHKARPVAERLRYSGSRDGSLSWELNAKSATRSVLDGKTVFDGVKAAFYSRDGKEYSLIARQGTLSEADAIVEATGSVEITEPADGLRYRSEEVLYSAKTREIISPGAVEVLWQGMALTGKGLSIDVDAGSFVLSGDVRATLRDEDTGGI